jgi:hypothetical protein
VGYEATFREKEKVNLKIKSNDPGKKNQALFSLSSGATVYGACDGGKLSTVGGAPLLQMVELATGYVAAVSACIKDWRNPNAITYTIFKQVWQRVLLICAGFSATIDSNHLRHDVAIKLAMGLDLSQAGHLASQPTMCRLENNVDYKDCYRMALCMLMLYISRKKRIPKEIVLDFDGSCVPASGDQQGTSYRSYWDTNMYFPLFVYDQDGWLICAILRPGKEGEARLTVPILKRIVKHLRDAWPDVRIIVRADSAFGSQELYNWCEDQGKADAEKEIYYIVCLRTPPEGSGISGAMDFREMKNKASRQFGKKHGPAQYEGVGAKTKSAMEKEAKALPKGERQKELKRLRERLMRVFEDGFYQSGNGGQDPKQWRQPRRIVAVCTQDDWGQTSRYFVTNLPVTTRFQSRYLIEELYSARGGMELRIKEYKALEGDKLSCREFAANQVRVLFHALAYNTMFELRQNLPGNRQSWTFTSIQKHLLRMAVRVTRKGQSITMHWATDLEWKNELWTCIKRLQPRLNTC